MALPPSRAHMPPKTSSASGDAATARPAAGCLRPKVFCTLPLDLLDGLPGGGIAPCPGDAAARPGVSAALDVSAALGAWRDALGARPASGPGGGVDCFSAGRGSDRGAVTARAGGRVGVGVGAGTGTGAGSDAAVASGLDSGMNEAGVAGPKTEVAGRGVTGANACGSMSVGSRMFMNERLDVLLLRRREDVCSDCIGGARCSS